MPEITPAQLSPHIVPPPARDPFRPAGEPALLGRRSGNEDRPGFNGRRARSNRRHDPLASRRQAGRSAQRPEVDRHEHPRRAAAGGHQRADLRGTRAAQEQGSVGPAVRRCPHPARSRAPGMRGPDGNLSYANIVAEPKANQAGGLAEPSGHGAPPQPEPPANSHTVEVTAGPGGNTTTHFDEFIRLPCPASISPTRSR